MAKTEASAHLMGVARVSCRRRTYKPCSSFCCLLVTATMLSFCLLTGAELVRSGSARSRCSWMIYYPKGQGWYASLTAVTPPRC